MCGDMNIAPTDADVFDPEAYVGQTHVTPPERAALAELQALGLHDVVRERWPDERVFTYWDYRAGMFHQDLGMRIDLVLAGAPVAERVRAAWVDRQARKGKGPSDHAPVIVDLDEAPDGDIGPGRAAAVGAGRAARRAQAAAVRRVGPATASQRPGQSRAGRGRARAGRAWARPASSGSRAGRACRRGPRPRRARRARAAARASGRRRRSPRWRSPTVGEARRHRGDGEVLGLDARRARPTSPAPTPARPRFGRTL